MKTTFALLLMTTAIGAATGALATVPALVTGPVGVVAEGSAANAVGLTQISDDNEDGSWFWPASNGGGSDDGNGGGSSSGGGNDDDCEDDDEGGVACGAGNAAPAGTVAPPSNGLFTKGTAPTATTN